jgi:glycosyltransferase involved in cell wall biosynthesis
MMKIKLLWAVLLLACDTKRRIGIIKAANKAWSVFKGEGWTGVRNRAIFLKSQVDRCEWFFLASERNDYTEWICRYDTLTDEMRAKMYAHIETLRTKPRISVVMPVYNPRPEWLIEAIESVRKQIYPNWELCIADDASTKKDIRPILKRYAREDARIKVVFRERNEHICAASNSALELATGEWIALLDHDDLLSEHALFWIADAVNSNPYARLIYSDEDKIDSSGTRSGPYFKCDWNEDLFYSHNMFCHLGAYQARLIREIGGFRMGFEGSQDYDLVLRCIERVLPSQIHHIPRVLYHWRMHSDSTAHSLEAKPYAMIAGERALNEHFLRKGLSATAKFLSAGYRIQHVLPDTPPLVSLIIPTKNRMQLLQKCIKSILKKTTYSNYEILIVDNGSNESATIKGLERLKSDPRIRVVRDDRPFNFSALNNAAVKLVRGEVVGLLNNDLEVISPDWLSEMVSHALRPEVGAVGAKLLYPNKTLQHGGVVLGIGGVAGHAHKHWPHDQYGYFNRASLIQSFSAVTAACLVIRKSVYEAVGGLNEKDLPVAFNDVDFCLRVREAGYRNIWTPYAELYHHESISRGIEDTSEKQARFTKEVQYMKQYWGDQLLKDPAYSFNLTLNHEDFSLAWPPRVKSI